MSAEARRELVARRNALSAAERESATAIVNRLLIQLSRERDFKRVAVYLAIKGELSLASFIEWLHREQRKVYLPKIDQPQQGEMQFIRFAPSTELEIADFGLTEPPAEGETLDARALELVCAPLLGFHGHTRMGWGKGYYDRCFAFRLRRQPPPLLVGVAFACQELAEIDAQPWDVPMDRIIRA